MTEMVFLLSTGRSGTKFLGEKLNQFDGVSAVHEPKPLRHRHVSRYLRRKHGTFRHMKIRNWLPYAWWYRQLFRWSRTWKTWFLNANYYVEANMYLTGFLPEVVKVFPGAKLVQVVRDPRDFAESALNRGMFLRRDLTSKRVTSYYVGDTSKGEWSDMTPVERIDWYWRYCNREIENQDPDLFLTFSSIFQSPHEGFRRFAEFLDISNPVEEDLFEEKVNPTEQKLITPFEEWDPSWQEQLEPAVNMYHQLRDRYLT